jgi:(p)ppGpp synthase/HD superfamily hydrolase
MKSKGTTVRFPNSSPCLCVSVVKNPGERVLSLEETSLTLSHRFEQALVYASVVHAGQVRKGSTIPYISHLLAVVALVLEHGGDEDEAIAALLHDAVEDAGGQPRLTDIRQRFGDRVADIVLGCTDTDVCPKPPWRARKEAYIAHLEHVTPSARLVSCCDKLHNARCIVADLRIHGDNVWTKFTGKRDGSLWYYTTLLAEYQRLDVPQPLVEELARTVEAMQTLAAP